MRELPFGGKYLNRCEKFRIRKNDEKPEGQWLRHSFHYIKISSKKGKMIVFSEGMGYIYMFVSIMEAFWENSIGGNGGGPSSKGVRDGWGMARCPQGLEREV